MKGLLVILLLFTCFEVAKAAAVRSVEEEIGFMKSADSASIFTVDSSGRRGLTRPMNDEARRLFVAFVSVPENFDQSLGFPINRPEVGIEFRKGDRKFTLYTTWQFSYFYDSFPQLGQTTTFFAVPVAQTFLRAQEWQERYFPRPVYASPSLSNAKSVRMLTEETADFIRTSETATFFQLEPGKKWVEPGRRQGDQLLQGTARDLLVAILADPTNYDQGLYCIVEPPPEYGFEFKKNGETLTIAPGGTLIDGGFRGRKLTGALSDTGSKMIRDWVKTYAAAVKLPDE